MPFKMPHEFRATGINIADSYWVLDRFYNNLRAGQEVVTMTFAGYKSMGEYVKGTSAPFDEQSFTLTGTDIVTYGFNFNTPSQTLSLVLMAEMVALGYPDPGTSYFASATQYSPITVSYGNANNYDVADQEVRVFFQGELRNAAIDYADGVTIKVNEIAATISSSSINSFELTELHYTLSVPIKMGDVIRFEYDGITGSLEDNSLYNLPIASTMGITLTNTVGTYWDFRKPSAAFQQMTMF